MFLSDLFRKIEAYYQQAVRDHLLVRYGQGLQPNAVSDLLKAGQGFYMPDTDEDEPAASAVPDASDGGLFAKLMQAAQQVSDPDLASELVLIANMYQQAIKIGGGYNSINRAISNIINMYLDDDENPEQSNVEDLLNQVVKDLRTRAGGVSNLNKPDSPQVLAQLKKFKDDFNNRAVQDEIDDLSKYDEKAVSTFDPTGGMGREEAQKGSGRGYSVQTVKSLKDWVEHYKNERQRYLEEIPQTNRVMKMKVDNIIAVLDPLISKLAQANQLKQSIANDPTPETQAALDKLLGEIKELRTKRTAMKQALRQDLLNAQQAKLHAELGSTQDTRAKFLLQQQLELNKTLSSKDTNKGEEIKLRKMLIAGMSGGNTLGLDTLKKLLDKIKEAAAKRVPVEIARKEQAKVIRDKKQAKSLEGLIIDLGQKLATQKIVVKQAITDKMRAEEHTVFQPYLNDLADAKRANNPEAIKVATKALQKAINEYAEEQPSVLAYKESTTAFYELRKLAQTVHKSGIMDKPGIIPPEIQVVMQQMITDGTQLISRFGAVKHFATVVAATQAIVDILTQRMTT
jgi:hypothetical protein